jgi:hypothetical protein
MSIPPTVPRARMRIMGVIGRCAILVVFGCALFAAAPAIAEPFVFGVGAVDPMGQASLSAADLSYLGATVARVEAASTLSVADIRQTKLAFDAKGIEIILVASRKSNVDGDPRPDAGPFPEQAGNLAAWAKAFGPGGPESGSRPVRHIEFGNENGWDYAPKIQHGGGATYANNYRAAYDAINAPDGNTDVGLLAQGDAQDRYVAAWVSAMFTAQPNLGAMVADNGGWVAHPYGPEVKTSQFGPGWKLTLDAVVDETARWGAATSIPLFITEWGVAITRNGRCLIPDNYGWPPCMDYDAAVAPLRLTVQRMHDDPKFGPRISRFMLYSQHDLRGEPGDGAGAVVTADPQDYFGALKTWYYGLPRDARLGQRDKGAYTTEVKRLAHAWAIPASESPPAVTSPPSAVKSPAPVFAACRPTTANVVFGGPGTDRRTGTPQGDRIFTGAGDDVVDALAGDDCIDLGVGADQAKGGKGNDLVLGQLGADHMSGNTGNDTLRGGGGADRINGNSGNDNVHGGSGEDNLSGGRGSDRINGNSGNDRISARDGTRDRIDCGSGRDSVTADRIDRVRHCEKVRRK